MSPEISRNHINFEDIISKAKETIIKDGKHIPTLIVEGGKNLVVGQIREMPETHGERVQLMRLLGETAAKAGRFTKLDQLFMVSEGWLSIPNENSPSEIRPSQDPNRKEVLVISNIRIANSKKQIRFFEILRDAHHQVSGLEEIIPDGEKSELKYKVPLLEAFADGFRTEQRARNN